MKTGYFAKLSSYKEKGLIPVAICGKSPDWYDGLEYKKLAPKYDFFKEWKYGNHKGDNEYYIKEFNSKVLSHLDIDTVISELEKLTNTKSDNIILICYEKSSDFCHRHLVSDWLRAKIQCDEEM